MKKAINSILLTLCLFGCANQASHLIVAPEINTLVTPLYNQQIASLQVADMRSGSHVLQILRVDKAAELYSPQAPIADVINRQLEKAYQQQGLVLAEQADKQIMVYIDTALISVQQTLMNYQANSHISLRVAVVNQDKTLTKTFTIKGNSNGPLRADMAVLERDFNQQLAKIIEQILTNTDIQQFIR
ncbi:YajG family lipoprotein [Colwelliaceae bacterium 6471]